jgi:glutamate/tyrosine decarboxylase-like PLP-dependent enzyme
MSFGSHGVEHVAGGRDSYDWVPESSRRARGFVILAALRALGRNGLIELIERDCALTRRIADRLSADPDVAILNDVVLNQALVRFRRPGTPGPITPVVDAAADAFTQEVIEAVQADGTLWLGGRVWHGLGCMRISIVGWNTTEADVDRSADVILRCRDEVAARALASA